MSKKEFLKKLEQYLVDLNDIERDKFVGYYEEMIEDYLENGLSEQEAVEKIGSPKEIAVRVLEDTKSEMFPVRNKQSFMEHMTVLLTFPVWGTFILSLCIMVFCVPACLFAIEAGLLIVGIVSIAGAPFVMIRFDIPVGIVQFGSGMICFGILLILFPVLLWFWKKTKIWIIRIEGKMMKRLKGEKSEQ